MLYGLEVIIQCKKIVIINDMSLRKYSNLAKVKLTFMA